MVRVARWLGSMVVAAHALRVIEIATIRWLPWCISTWSWHVGLLSWLWADSSESAESWRSLVVMVVSDWLAVSVDRVACRVGIQEIIIVINDVVIIILVGSMIVVADICLTKLVEDWSRSFGIDGRYLSHDLAIVRMATLVELSSLGLFSGTHFRWTILVVVIMVPILSSTCLICSATSSPRVAHCAILLVVCDSIIL